MKTITAILVLVALLCVDQSQSLTISQDLQKKTAVVQKAAAAKKTVAKKVVAKVAAKKVVKKEPEAEEESTATQTQNFSGADESETIENIYDHYGTEAMNAAGIPSGEKIVLKEDAKKAGAEIIEAVKGVKGQKLEKYMKAHFDTTWA